MPTKRKTADQAQDITTTDAGTATLPEQQPAANPTAETASPAAAAVSQKPPAGQESSPPLGSDGKHHTMHEPGDDTAVEQSAGQKKSSWAPRTTIAVPLTEEAKRDHTKGEVARYIDGYNYEGVGARIDSPDPDFRPSQDVKAALKEEHPYRESMRWNDRILHNDKKTFQKKVTGKRPDGSERSPVGERLDGEGRFEEMVLRRRDEIEKAGGGRTPI